MGTTAPCKTMPLISGLVGKNVEAMSAVRMVLISADIEVEKLRADSRAYLR